MPPCRLGVASCALWLAAWPTGGSIGAVEPQRPNVPLLVDGRQQVMQVVRHAEAGWA